LCRFKACLAAQVDPVFKPFEGENPVAYVVSKNLHRRHLTASQRTLIAKQMASGAWGGDRSKVDKSTLSGEHVIAEVNRIAAENLIE
jgi:hypothetical protein